MNHKQVNELFEKLIEACKEYGFTARQISVGMQYMGEARGNYRFRDGNTHAAILLSLNPLKATLVDQRDSAGNVYWGEAELAEYRLTDEEVTARAESIARIERFSRSSELWKQNRTVLVGAFNQAPGSNGPSPNDVAKAILAKSAEENTPEFLAFVEGVGSSDSGQLCTYLLSPYFDEQEDVFWSKVIGHPSYPELIRLSNECHALSSSESAALDELLGSMSILLAKVYSDSTDPLHPSYSRRAFFHAPFHDSTFLAKIHASKEAASAIHE